MKKRIFQISQYFISGFLSLSLACFGGGVGVNAYAEELTESEITKSFDEGKTAAEELFEGEIPSSPDEGEAVAEGSTKSESINVPEEEKTVLEESILVSLDYKKADLGNVLRSLAQAYELNLVASPDVQGKVTVSLHDVPLGEALTAILSANSYAYFRKGKVIYITSGPGLKGFKMDTVVVPLKYLTPSEASLLVEDSLSQNGKVRINETTNSLVITDYSIAVEKLKEVIEKIDLPPIQVLIEAKMIDITEYDRNNWGLSFSDVTYDPDGARGVSDGAQSMGGPSTSLSGGQWTAGLTFKSLSGTITVDALIQKQKAHLLASPSIMTLSGKEAKIIIGERYPYKEKTQTTTGTTETTKFVDIGTTLRVTPWVSPEGIITMHIHPEVSAFTAALDAGPRISTREADATVRVKDGETIVIGGLIKRQDDRIRGRIPGVGYIPILNWFFSDRSKDLTSTELVVFITPHVIRPLEERLAARDSEVKRDVYVNIEGTGERVMVNQLWFEADDLMQNSGAIAQNKSEEFRKAAALDLYRQIAQQFPKSERADDALYIAGKMAYNEFKDYKLAEELFAKLAKDYPKSPFNGKAESKLKKARKKLQKHSRWKFWK